MNVDEVDQIKDAYRQIATAGGFALPSDGELNDSAVRWMEDENRLAFHIGCPDGQARKALIWTIEAARLQCGVNFVAALKLLQLATAEVRNQIEARKKAGIDSRGLG